MLACLAKAKLPVSGSVQIKKSFNSRAYVAQKPFLMNATIRENILFHSPLVQSRYQEVLRICCLTQDLAMFPDNDETLVGE